MSGTDEVVVPLHEHLIQRFRRHVQRLSLACHRLFQLYRTTLRAFFFPDSFQLYTGTMVRGLFALYYIPFLAISLAVTHSALQRVVWVLIIPIAQEMERNPYNYSYWATFLYGISNIFLRIIPFAALGLAVLTVGYKIQHCVGEAMMDAFVRHEGEDYPLLHARLRVMREDRTRETLFLSVLSLAVTALIVLLHTNFFVMWTMSGERRTLVLSAWSIIVVEACFVAFTAVTGAPKDMMEEQWNSLVSPIRRALTAPGTTELTDLAHVSSSSGGGGEHKSLPSVDASASPLSGPSSPQSPHGSSGTTGRRQRRRREPFWRPLLQSKTGTPEAARSPGGVGNASLAGVRGVAPTPTLSSPPRQTAPLEGGGPLAGGSATSSIGLPPLSPVKGAAGHLTDTAVQHDASAWRRHSTTDATLATRSRWDDTSLQTSLASSSVGEAGEVLHGRSSSSSDSNSSSSNGSSDSSDEDGFGEEDTFLVYFQEDWWRDNIHMMRYVAIGMVTAECFVIAIQRGLVNGLTLGVLLIMCLNLPHLVGYATLAVCTATLRTNRSFMWLHHHMDAFWPFVVLVSPYQVPLLYAIVFFRHHPLTVLLLLGATVLLLARGIDLVREFDVTEKGCVHWRNRATGVLLTPSLASLLEEAYTRAHHRPDLVSLDLVIDIPRMRIYDLASKTEVSISRTQVFPYGAARRYLRQWDFYSFVIPRMVSLQSPGYFTGSKFRVMRVALRVLMVLLALSVSVITLGILLQAAFPTLRPLPVRVQSAQNGHALIFDHVVVRMHLQAKHGGVAVVRPRDDDAGDDAALMASELVTETASSSWLSDDAYVAAVDGNDTTAPAVGSDSDRSSSSSSSAEPTEETEEEEDGNSSQVMLKLNNVTSEAGVDFYPQLCTRDYYGTSVWELALLALAPYLYNVDELTTMLRFMNTHLGSDWELRPRHGRSCRAGPDSSHQPTGWTGYFEVHSESRNTSVIAVRGTDLFSFTDFLIDMNLFFEPVLFQVLANTIPGARLLPKELVVDAIHAASLPETLVAESEEPLQTWRELQQSHNHSLRRCRPNNYMRNFFADVENHLAYIGSRPGRPRHVIVTGHSMGGAVASIVASRMGVQAVAFSAPGVVSARKKFGIDLMDLHQRVVTVASSNDIVPQMGEQGGEVQHLECLAERRELCHAMEFMVGTLWRSCSSVRERFPSMDNID